MHCALYMGNMSQILSKHNKRVLSNGRPKVAVREDCNCAPRSPPCPLLDAKGEGHCLTPGVIYKAEVTATEAQPAPDLPIITRETYTGLSKPPFKERYRGHTHDMKHEDVEGTKGTTLSKHVWTLKRAGTPFTISWSIQARGEGYSPSGSIGDWLESVAPEQGLEACFCWILGKKPYIFADEPTRANLNMCFVT